MILSVWDSSMSFSHSGDGQSVILSVFYTGWFSLTPKSCCNLDLFPPCINVTAPLGFNGLRLPGSQVESFIFSLSPQRDDDSPSSPSKTQTATYDISRLLIFSLSLGNLRLMGGPLRRKKNAAPK